MTSVATGNILAFEGAPVSDPVTVGAIFMIGASAGVPWMHTFAIDTFIRPVTVLAIVARDARELSVVTSIASFEANIRSARFVVITGIGAARAETIQARLRTGAVQPVVSARGSREIEASVRELLAMSTLGFRARIPSAQT